MITAHDGLTLLHNTAFTTTFFPPLPAALSQFLDTTHTTSPETFNRRTEGISSLTADNTNCLKNSFPAISSEDSWVIDPFQASFELRVEC